MKCTDCANLHFKRMIDIGPFQFYGDIPCTRCKHHKIENDEFVKIGDSGVAGIPKQWINKTS